MKELKSFIGTGWSFPPAFELGNKGVVMVSEEEDVKQSLRILMTTYPGERLTNLEYGCDLQRAMFKEISSSTIALMKDIISTAVLMFESRVDLENIDIKTGDDKQGLVTITLTYMIRKINVRDNVVLPFYKVEGTNIVEV